VATHQLHNTKDDFYFVTFTCYNWLPLFDESNIYEYLPEWSLNLRRKGVEICAYVFMANHAHLMVYVNDDCEGLNKVFGEAKRFLAYKIITGLKLLNKTRLLKYLSVNVRNNEQFRGKKHQVFRDSFDARLIESDKSVAEVLHYIHMNPVSGKWQLIDNYLNYPYSSAAFFELGETGFLPIRELDDILLYPDIRNQITNTFEPNPSNR
jgi:REP element-mobilizing transposase RayT